MDNGVSGDQLVDEHVMSAMDIQHGHPDEMHLWSAGQTLTFSWKPIIHRKPMPPGSSRC